MVERKGFRAYKRLKNLHMKNGCKQTRVERSALLAKQFSERSPALGFQDFPLQIPTNRQNNRVSFLDLKMILTLIVCFMKVTDSP